MKRIIRTCIGLLATAAIVAVTACNTAIGAQKDKAAVTAAAAKLAITYTAGDSAETVTPQTGGPGTHAVGDTYPHHQYPQINSLSFYYDADDSVFAFGTPFLTRSSVVNLQEEISAHNSLKRSPPEPLLKADELDFYWDRIKELRQNTAANR